MSETTDIDDYVELKHSSYDILAPEAYKVRPPQDPAYIFLIHVHREMITSGAFSYIVDCIRDNLDDLHGDERCRVMFITYDSTIHFYNVSKGSKLPQMLCVPDISQRIMPCSWKECFVKRNESKNLLIKLLDDLPLL